ncbi:unnamed protein product, partial [Owenia fusiformis]
PGSFTLQGTNSYLIGSGDRRILIDTTNPDKPEYTSNLKQVLKEHKTSIQEIILTHWHIDHVGGIQDVFKEVLKSSKDIKISKFSRDPPKDESFGDDLKLTYIKDGSVFTTEGATLKAVYTPGHTDDHMSLYLEEENAVFSGDTVLGEGTAVFEDLFDYMKSLDKILQLKPSVIYPSHGRVVDNPIEHVQAYIDHRNMRERQILETLSAHSGKAMSAMDLVKIIYKDVPPHLHIAAAGNVTHHLTKLLKEGTIEHSTQDNDDKWTIKSNL